MRLPLILDGQTRRSSPTCDCKLMPFLLRMLLQSWLLYKLVKVFLINVVSVRAAFSLVWANKSKVFRLVCSFVETGSFEEIKKYFSLKWSRLQR